MNSNKYIPREEEEQATLVDWLELNGFMFTAIPNSTYTPSWRQKRKNYIQGLRPGLPDLLVIIPNQGLLFIEMKRLKGSKIYDHQKRWIEELNKIDGVEAVICKGANEAIFYIQNLTRK